MLLINHSLAASSSEERLSWINWVFVPETKRAESSAYKRSLQRTAVEISFIYIRNNKGPRIEPCGTPHATVIGFDIVSLISTDCCRSHNYYLNQTMSDL